MEEVFYRELVEDLLQLVRMSRRAGAPAPLILHELSTMILAGLAEQPAKMASLAALALVMIEEEEEDDVQS